MRVFDGNGAAPPGTVWMLFVRDEYGAIIAKYFHASTTMPELEAFRAGEYDPEFSYEIAAYRFWRSP